MPSMETLYNVIGAIWKFIRKLRRKRRFRIFLSIQMSQLSDEEYRALHLQSMELVCELRKADDVAFYNEFIERQQDFDHEKLDSRSYLRDVKDCDFFIAVIAKKVSSSIYFEAGYAHALRKPCIYYVTHDSVLPVLMRVLGKDHKNVKTVIDADMNSIALRIVNALNNVRHGNE